MITAGFIKKDDRFSGFKISGHSGYAESGKDIVCAAVSSAVQTVANIIADQFGIECESRVNDKNAEIYFNIKDRNVNNLILSDKLLKGLFEQLKEIQEEYPGFLSLSVGGVNDD